MPATVKTPPTIEQQLVAKWPKELQDILFMITDFLNPRSCNYLHVPLGVLDHQRRELVAKEDARHATLSIR